MAIQVINTGTSANSGNGDSIRTAFTKVNQNFDYLEGIVMGTSTNFNSGVRSVVKPMLVHDSHNGLVAAYNSINDRIVFTVGSNLFTATNIVATNLTVANTSTFKDVQITGLLNIGIIQGFDDVNIIKFADDGSLNLRMRNTYGLGNTQINLLDQVNGSFNIIHQNSPANSGFLLAGQNYIYDDQGRAINIGRNSDINFYSRSGWNGYTTPEVAITNTAVNITSTLTLTKNFFNIGGKQLSISGSSILLDNSNISVITDSLSAGIYTATLTTAGNLLLPGGTSIAYNRRLPTGNTVTSFGATFSSDGPFSGVGSVYFDGSDRLEVNNNGQFDSVVDTYTIEWFQKPLTAGTATDGTILILGTEENQTVQARNFYATSVYSTGTYTAFTFEGTLEAVLPFTGTFVNTWTHIAYVKSTTTFSAYINGNQIFSTNTNAFPTPISTSNNLVIGTRPTLATYENYYNGLISNLRWEAREVYTSNFVPPGSKLTATTFTRFLLQSENSINYLDDASGVGIERPQNIQINISTSSLVLNENGVLILNQHRDYEYGELAGNTFRIDTNHPYYTQMAIQNRNNASTATSDIVLVRDDGDLSAGTGILDIGINSSNYVEPTPYGIHSPGSAYIFSNDADLIIGTQSLGKVIKFHAGGSNTTDSAGELNSFFWQFNRSVRTIVATPGPLNFLVQNTQNNSAAAALYQARNNVDNFVTFGIWSGNAGVEDGNQGPNESFLYASSTATLNIGKSHDIDFYTDQVNGYAGTPTLTLSRIDRTSTFNGNVIPREDLTYDLGSPTKQWNNLYVGSSTIYLGNVPMSLSGTTLLIAGAPVGEANTGQVGFNGQKIISKNNGKVWIDPSNSVGNTARIVVPSSATANTDSLLIENLGTGGISLRSNNYEILLDSSGNISIPGNIVPDNNDSFDLGSPSNQWRSLYVSTNTIYIGGIPITVNPNNNTLVVGTSSGVSSTSTNIATESYVIDYVAANVGGGGGGGGGTVTPSSIDTFTNKTINIAVGQGNVFQIQGNSISSYSGSGAILALTSMPTFSGLNINNSSVSLDGGSGVYYWTAGSADGSGSINKSGVYRSASTSSNSLFTFGANGAGTMSVQLDGSLFIGSSLPSNNGGLNTDYAGWLVVNSGGKFGGDVDIYSRLTVNTIQFEDDSGVVDFFGAAAGNHIVTCAPDWTLKLKSRASDANQGHLWLESGVNTKVKIHGNGSSIDFVASDGSTTATWSMSKLGVLTLPNGSILFDSSFIAATGTNAVLSQFDGNTQVYTMDTAVGVQTFQSSTYYTWLFNNNGTITFPDGTTQTTAYIGGGGVGGTTSTLISGTATLSINTLSETLLPSGLLFQPIENYGFGFGGTIAMQTYGEQLQVLATGTGAVGLFGYGEVIGGPGGVAYLVGNQDGTNEVKIVAGSYTATVNTWEFKNNGDLIIPNAILGSGDQALVIQNTASGVAYLELPVDPSTDSLILANQAVSSATVTIRVGDFGSEKDWIFNEFGSLAVPPGGIYNNDTSNVGQLLLAGDVGEADSYLALPSNVGSTSMNVRLGNISGNIQLNAGNNKNWYFNTSGDLELPGGSVLATSGYDVALVAGNDSSSTFGSVTISTQYPPDLTDRNWEFNSLGEFYLPLGSAIQETDVTNEAFGTTTTSLTLVPAGAANGTQRLEIYGTAGGEGNHIHITSGDQNQTDLYLGNDTQFFAVGAMGQIEVRARPGLDSPSPGTGAESGSPVWIYAGDAGDNGGNTVDGAPGGDILLQSGVSSTGLGGEIILISANGPAGFGSVKLSTDGGSSHLEFDQNNTLTFPSGGGIIFDSSATSTITGISSVIFADSTEQTTAWVAGGSSSLNSSLISINDFPNASFINSSSLSISYDAYSGGPSFNFAIDYQAPLTENIGIDVGAIKTPYILSTSTVELKTNLSSSTSTWTFGTDGGLTFPDGTAQSTAFTGTSALLDITNTNGIDTTYYLTFVENRTAGQEVRADVDLTWNSWSNTLGVGKISINSTASSTSTTTGALTVAGGVGVQGDLWAGNIYSNGVQLTAGGGGGGVTSITAGTGTVVSTSTGNVTIWTTGGGGGSTLEQTFESKTTATGVILHDCTTNRLFYHTGLTGNFTPNFTNLNLSSGEATSISLVMVQGATARMPTAVQIESTSTGVSLLWQGSSTAPSGNASRTDVVTFSILCTATNAYTILGMLTSFGGSI